MTVYTIRRDTGKILVCEFCREHIRPGDSYPFCKRKRCEKKRAEKNKADALSDMNQGGPAVKVNLL